VGKRAVGRSTEREIEEKEEGQGYELSGEDVPGPGAEIVEEGWGGRFAAEEHVVGFVDVVEGADEQGVDVGGDERARDRAGARPELTGPDEVESGADDEAVVDEELNGEEGCGVDEVGCEERLGGSGDGPVVGDVEDGGFESEERRDDEPERGVAEFERNVVGEHGSAGSGVVDVHGDRSRGR